MKIKDIFKKDTVSFSFEIFPPNEKYELDTIYPVVEELSKLSPDFISVTYGSGGGTRKRTAEIAGHIKSNYNIEPLAHLTCIEASKSEILNICDELKSHSIENILALRGDNINAKNNLSEFEYASDLINFISNDDFSIGAACYPEGHIENNDLLDLIHLKTKVDCGADFLISQIFFDNETFFKFKENAQKLNVDVPILAGIMPVINKKQIKRIIDLCGCSLPPKFLRMLDKYEHDPKSLKQAGIAYAIDQIVDLMTYGIDGVHFYTMNKANITSDVVKAISEIKSSLQPSNFKNSAKSLVL